LGIQRYDFQIPVLQDAAQKYNLCDGSLCCKCMGAIKR